MGRSPYLRKGSWTKEEDKLLKKCMDKYGEGKWKHIPERAGLNRCRKSCRLRWLNYLRPNIKRGDFADDEVDLIIRLHKLLGNRWTLIAGRIPGRTANDIKNYWNCHLSKKLVSENKNISSLSNTHNIDHCGTISMNSKSSREFSELNSPNQRQQEEERQEEEEVVEGDTGIVGEREETSSFWRSLLLEGEKMETNRNVEYEGCVIDDDTIFLGFEDLLKEIETWGVLSE